MSEIHESFLQYTAYVLNFLTFTLFFVRYAAIVPMRLLTTNKGLKYLRMDLHCLGYSHFMKLNISKQTDNLETIFV